MSSGLGKRIISIDNKGKPIFKNAISSDKWVGEIQLVKENEDNICNLCRNKADKLCDDHVPPQCMGNKGRFHYINYLNFCTKQDEYFGLFQGGIKYNTICENCNSETLSKYDREIASFTRLLTDRMRGKENVVKISCNPHIVIKGLIGHLLSTSLTNNPSNMELQMLAYFWGNEKFSQNVSIYILPYYDENLISILREIGWISSSNQSMFFSCIKCFPLCFLIMFDGELKKVPTWNSYLYDERNQNIDIDLRWKFEKWFPELYYPPESGRLLGHTAAHSILGFREKEMLPNEINIG